jgi:predicted DsbA family dithiol-disulfide isomerase
MKIDIWSDIVCPWCYIGKRRLESALAQFPQRDEIQIVWRSFELDPGAPHSDDGVPVVEALAKKYGIPVEQAQAMVDNVTKVAAAEGLDFRFDIQRRGNSFDAHRLLHFALTHGVQDDLKERLDHGTFTAGEAVSDHDSLMRAAADVGLDEVEVKEVLISDRYADAVRADEAQARAYGISGVPFFVIDEKFGVSGAQPPEVLLDAITRAWSEKTPSPLQSIGDDGAVCEDEFCFPDPSA